MGPSSFTEPPVSIAALRKCLAECPEDEEKLEELARRFSQDPRAGAQQLAQTARKRAKALRKEKERVRGMLSYEREYASQGLICGVDEVGRGPLAGPVMAGAVILPADCELLYANDSKQLSAKRREELDVRIRRLALGVGLGRVEPEEIDRVNILQATYQAMRQAVAALPVKPDFLLIDAVTVPDLRIPQLPIVKGDAKSLSIAAASIVAKVARDRLMEEYAETYPGYGFARNKGYGSQEHIEALRRLGPSPIHRRSFIGHFVEDAGTL